MGQPKVLQPRSKSLVLGLGGTGKNTLVQLKRRLMEDGYKDTVNQPNLKLLCFDFDPAQEMITLHGESHEEAGLSPEEFCFLDAGKIENRLVHLDDEHNRDYFREWYPDLAGEAIRLGVHRAGAAQWRPLGRIGYFEHAAHLEMGIKRAFNRLMEETGQSLRNQDTSGQVTVYIIASLAGGTGAGIFLDVGYFIRSLPYNIRTVGMFLLPGIYSEFDISGRIYANTYASLKELNALANQSEPFNAVYPNGREVSVAAQGKAPFDSILLYDNLVARDETTTDVRKMARRVAETVFLDLTAQELCQGQESSMTNLATLTGGDELGPLAERCVFHTTGSITLTLPPLSGMRDYWIASYLPGIILAEAPAPPEGGKAGPDFFGGIGDQLNGEVETKVAELASDRTAWNDERLNRMARDLGRYLMENRLEAKSADEKIGEWLEALVSPGPEGSFESPPKSLPDLEPGGALKEALNELKPRLSERIGALVRVAGQGQKGTWVKHEIDSFLARKADQLRQDAEPLARRTREAIEDPGGPMEALRERLRDLFRARPPHWGETHILLAEHWALSFLREVRRLYKGSARRLRIYLLMARVLDDLRKEHSDDHLTEIQEVAALIDRERDYLLRESRDRRDGLARLLGRDQDTVALNLADGEFLEKSWSRISSPLASSSPLQEFADFVLRSLEEEKRAKKAVRRQPVQEIGGEELLGRMTAFAAQRVDAVLKRLGPNSAEGGDDPRELCAYLDTDRFTRYLARTRHDYMLDNTVENPNRRSLVMAVLPCYSEASQKEALGVHYRALAGMLSSVLESTTMEYLNYIPREDEEGRIIIRHLSLNHPSYNLREIDHFYNAYSRRGERRRLFHADRNFDRFTEIIRPSQKRQYPTCGNPGCGYDLSAVPREKIICPGCGQPIKSRCGNSDCPENYLNLRPEMAGPDPQKHCPECHSLARTYWWWCPDHNVHISTSSDTCLLCQMEFDRGERSFDDIQRREGVKRTINCPGCVHDRVETPFKIEFLDVYDQVPENLVGRALKVYHEETAHGHCPKCSAILLPLCPQTKPGDPPHFVQRARDLKEPPVPDKCADKMEEDRSVRTRGQGFFYCSNNEHAKDCIRECSFCGMPLKDEATYCPRCKRAAHDFEPESKEEARALRRARMVYTGKPDESAERRCCDEDEDGSGPPPPDPPPTPSGGGGAEGWSEPQEGGAEQGEEAADGDLAEDGDTAAFVEQASQEGLDPDHIRDAARGMRKD